MKEKVISFIPIKLNNQRLPGKNTMKLNGRPLCDYIFDTICKIEEIDEKYVYCSDESINLYIEPYSAAGLRLLKRDACLDKSEVKGLEIINAFVNDVDADIYVLTHTTQPFSQVETIKEGIRKVMNDDYDSAFAAIKLQDYMWVDGKPMNYDPKDIIRTQDMKPIYMETGAFFVFRREVFTEKKQRIGDKPYICEVNHFEAVDIDDKDDFMYAEVIAKYLLTEEMNA